MTSTAPIEVPRGLAGVVVTDTELGDVRGREGFYHYRQYSAIELAETRTFEDVWHLMIDRTLPDRDRRETFIRETAPLRTLPAEITNVLPAVANANGEAGPLAGTPHGAGAARRPGRVLSRVRHRS